MNSAATESREKSTQAKPDTRAPGGGTKKPLLSLDKKIKCDINLDTSMPPMGGWVDGGTLVSASGYHHHHRAAFAASQHRLHPRR
jgi:hypothetical protein